MDLLWNRGMARRPQSFTHGHAIRWFTGISDGIINIQNQWLEITMWLGPGANGVMSWPPWESFAYARRHNDHLV